LRILQRVLGRNETLDVVDSLAIDQSMDQCPKVSVIVPAYNVQNYIEEALLSLQHQSCGEFEALVVDDGSTDGTAEIVKRFCNQDSRFKLLQKTNGGLSSARNHGIRHASTDYIALLDADDRYESEKLTAHLKILEHHPEVGVVYSASKTIRDDGASTFIQLSGKPIYADPLKALLCKNFIGHGSNAVFRRCIVDKVGYFDETLRSSEDVDYWIRIATLDSWTFYRDPHPLVCYRVRPSGLSFNVGQMQRSNEQVLQSAYRRSPEKVQSILPTAYAYLYRYLARLALTSGNSPEARRLISCALKKDAGIFLRDGRSFITLCAVVLAPVTRAILRQSLGSPNITNL
jgi:glycosyltransferase involved in cell wall biosynthesis